MDGEEEFFTVIDDEQRYSTRPCKESSLIFARRSLIKYGIMLDSH